MKASFLFLALSPLTSSFVIPVTPPAPSRALPVIYAARGNDNAGAVSRRTWAQRAPLALAVAAAVEAAPWAAFAAPPVGEGGLPDGARQFDAVLRAQRDWVAIGKRVKRGDNISDEEWKNIALYLRKLYAVGDDMASIAKGLDRDKQAGATALVKSFKEDVKAIDPVITAKDVPKFLTAFQATAKQIDSFLVLLQDVPDEL